MPSLLEEKCFCVIKMIYLYYWDFFLVCLDSRFRSVSYFHHLVWNFWIFLGIRDLLFSVRFRMPILSLNYGYIYFYGYTINFQRKFRTHCSIRGMSSLPRKKNSVESSEKQIIIFFKSFWGSSCLSHSFHRCYCWTVKISHSGFWT